MCFGTKRSKCIAAKVRQDGWAGYEPLNTDRPGIVLTTPVTLGDRLRVTADALHGSVQVSVIDANGTLQATSEPVRGDVTNHAVTFASNAPAKLSGRPVQLRFELREAKVYSFTVSE
jgi:hypothetical protein